MRVLTTRRRKGIVQLIIFDRSGRRLPLSVRVVWSKRVGFRKHIIGLELVDPSEESERDLARIGTTGFFDG